MQYNYYFCKTTFIVYYPRLFGFKVLNCQDGGMNETKVLTPGTLMRGGFYIRR